MVAEDSIEIYDISLYDLLIEKILDTPHLTASQKITCIKEIFNRLHLYDEMRMIFQCEFGKYQYFIPEDRLKNEQGIIKK